MKYHVGVSVAHIGSKILIIVDCYLLDSVPHAIKNDNRFLI